MPSKVVKAIHHLSKASDVRDDTKKIMQPYSNWEEYLTPAPLSIAILGQLVFISSNDDFSINKNPPKDGFKHIRYPESFRACLMQVCNSGWGAFNEAHKNMDQIRLHTGNVPDYIKMTVKILMQDDDELVKTLLPDQLETIDKVSQNCLSLAEKTEKKFMDAIELIQELLEACMNAKHCYSEDRDKVRLKINEAKLRKQASEDANKRAKKSFEQMKKHLDKAQESFNKSLDSMPSGWEVMGMNVVEGLTHTLNSAVASVVNQGLMTNPILRPNYRASPTKVRKEEANPDAVQNIFSKSNILLNLCTQLKTFVDDKKQISSKIYDQNKQTAACNYQRQMFESTLDDITAEKECAVKAKAQNLCKECIDVCKELETYTLDVYKDKKNDHAADVDGLVKSIETLLEKAQTFDSEAKAKTNVPVFQVTAPHLSAQVGGMEGESAGQMAVDQARLKIQQSQIQLDKTRELYEKSVKNMEKNKRELTDILVQLQNCKVKEIDFNHTIKMLVKGMDAMGRVKEQWEKMVRFFEMVCNIVKTCLDTCLNNFLKTAKKASSSSLKYSSRMFMKDLLYTQAFQASNVSSLVNMISGTYVEVSNRYLMDRVSSLGKLMALKPDSPDFENERQLLQSSCTEAQEGILKLVLKNKRSFENNTKTRIEKIKGDLKAVLPPPEEGEEETTKRAVQKGFEEPTQEEEDQYC